ncbi:MAG: hypothetical protein HZA54_15425, partial [Planctomycetes bacterium]|nr:hypothetical protein [Planctomycetota bacterium]
QGGARLRVALDGRALGRRERQELAGELGAEVTLVGAPAPGWDADLVRERRRGFGAEWEHLAGARTPAPATGDAPEGWVALLAAQQACRLLALRLPGLSGAGARFLGERLLRGAGSLRAARGGGRRIRMRPGPLGVALGVAGVREQTIRLPWLEGPVTLDLE